MCIRLADRRNHYLMTLLFLVRGRALLHVLAVRDILQANMLARAVYAQREARFGLAARQSRMGALRNLQVADR